MMQSSALPQRLNTPTENPELIPNLRRDLRLEQSVIGCCIWDGSLFSEVQHLLRKDDFFDARMGSVWEAMENLSEKGLAVDQLTVMHELRRMDDLEKIGGSFFLAELPGYRHQPKNIEAHANQLRELSMLRRITVLGQDIFIAGQDATVDPHEVIEEKVQEFFKILESGFTKRIPELGELVGRYLKKLEEISKMGEGLTGIPSGFMELDRVTAGWQDSDLIIVAARPGMGKSSFLCCLCRNAAVDFDKPVALFSLEMSELQIVQRLIGLEAEISGSSLRTGKLHDYEWTNLERAVEKISNAKIFIDDTPGISLTELKGKCRQLKIQHDIQMIVVDYLQLMTNPATGKNRELEIGSISRGLKGIAKELNVPVIALCQLSRAVETRGGTKRPMLSDLRESGSIEQDADIVSFIYRPEYYSILEDEEGQSLRGIAEIIIAKHRNGALKTVKLKFTDQYAKFSNLEDPNFNELIEDIKPETYPLEWDGQTSIVEAANANGITAKPRNRMNDDDIPY